MAVSFADLGRVEAIRQLFEGTGFKPFKEPLSLDCADGKRVVNASRLMLEGVDFDLVYFPLKHLGYKAVLSATGELLARLAQPQTVSVVLGISAKLDFEQVKELWGGVVTAAKEHGVKSLSLDLQPSRNGLTVSVSASGTTSCGEWPEASSKDLICVSGSLGAAYFGLQLLEREKMKFEQGSTNQESLDHNRMLVAAYLKPELDAAVVRQFPDSGITPTYGCLVTRGLSDALLRLVRDTGLGAKVYADKIPFEGGSFALGKDMNIDPVSAAMNGGDDLKLLFTVPIMQYETFRRDFQTFTIIGHLAQANVGAVLVTPEGLEHPVSAQGWSQDNQD